MRTRTTTLALATAALLALTGCSSSDGSDDAAPSPSAPTPSAPATTDGPADPSPTPTSAAASDLEQAVKAYTDAYFGGDADTAYAALSERCAGEVTPELYGAIVDQAATDYGDGHPATDVQADVSGDLARVSYRVEGLPKFDQKAQPWTREGDAWKYDAC